MRRAVAFLLVLMLAPVGASAQEDTAMQRFLTDWTNALYQVEDRYSQENHALDLIVRFSEEPTWENMVIAQTMTEFTLRLLEYYGNLALEITATSEDYAALIAQGMDIADVRNTLESYDTIGRDDIRQTELAVWNDFMAELMYYAFEAGELREMARAAQNQKRLNEMNLEEWCLITHYILLELPPDEAQQLADWANRYTPAVMSAYSQPLETTNDVLNQYDDLLARMEEFLSTDMTEALTVAQYRLDNLQQLEAQPIEGLPLLLPYPQAVTPEAAEYHHYWKNEAGEISTATRLMDIQELPNCFALDASGLALADYQAYVLLLADFGYQPDEMNDMAALYLLDGGGELLVFWDDGSQCLQIHASGAQVCFAPQWYLQATAS